MQIESYADFLVEKNILPTNEITQTAADAKKNNLFLADYLLQHNILSYATIAKSLSEYLNIPLINPENIDINNLPIAYVGKEFIKQYQLLPIKKEDNYLEIAIANPKTIELFNEIQLRSNLYVKPIIAPQDKLESMINKILHENQFADNEDIQIINFVEQIFINAVNKNASDIHFEPYNNQYRIRFRIDGILHNITQPDTTIAKRITSRLKIMADLDIAERRIPQDGRFSIEIKGELRDFRINTCPTLYGEKVVVRLLNPTNNLITLEQLGLEENQLQLLTETINQPQGMIIITGPTGSGKTITMYAALDKINSIEKNISTVEDPIEINLPGINQVNIHPKIGLTFANTLRAFLRQDPDIIMVGEIRDLETAEIAIHSAQTGHLVLTTLHTNNAIKTVIRLQNLGVANYNIISALSLVVAQRLLRKLCSYCKQRKAYPHNFLIAHGFTNDEIKNLAIYSAKGCKKCTNGYKGRIGIFELLPVNNKIHELLIQNTHLHSFVKTDFGENIQTLRQSALNKVRAGITSLEEIDRVLL